MQPSVLTAEELQERLADAFPEAFHRDNGLAILDVWHRGCRLRMGFAAHRLRPGGTISGPNLMMLADVAMYARRSPGACNLDLFNPANLLGFIIPLS
jgi:acyl-coenzyme A thioesterase PaaI-like protein